MTRLRIEALFFANPQRCKDLMSAGNKPGHIGRDCPAGGGSPAAVAVKPASRDRPGGAGSGSGTISVAPMEAAGAAAGRPRSTATADADADTQRAVLAIIERLLLRRPGLEELAAELSVALALCKARPHALDNVQGGVQPTSTA